MCAKSPVDTLIETVVETGLCTRCGTCVGACPAGNLVIDDPAGSCLPSERGLCTSCGLCLSACPGASVDFAPLEKSHFGDAPSGRLLGVVRDAWLAHAAEAGTRRVGSSGGVVTQNQKQDLPFNLTITITNKGFTVAGSNGVMYENDVPGRLPTVPKNGRDYDLKRLQALLVKVKKEHPKELQAILSANSDTPYETIVSVMDVVRLGPTEEPLFPSIVFSAGIEY